jgi:hypothetical protein
MEWRLYQQKKVTMANEHTCSFSLDNLSFENSTLIFTANNKLKLSTPQGMKLSIKLDELRGYNRENRTLEIVRRPGQANVMIHFQSRPRLPSGKRSLYGRLAGLLHIK